jgi:hypothetical protein
MTRFGFFRLLAIVPLFALVGCGDDPVVVEDPTVTGSWIGTTGTTTLLLTMNEAASGAVTGGGSLTDASTVALTISSGTHVFPNLTLTITATGFSDLNLTGTVTSATSIAASLNGSGYENEAINLAKQ